MEKKASRPDWEDDGRTIADMNVEGMPWYVDGDKERLEKLQEGSRAEMDPQQLKLYRWAALKAGLLIVLVFGGVFFLFLLFCDFVWFR